MDMIGHDNAAVDEVAFAVEVVEGICDNPRGRWLSQFAVAVSLIEPTVDGA